MDSFFQFCFNDNRFIWNMLFLDSQSVNKYLAANSPISIPCRNLP
jgi:hypothetical protein